MARITLREVTLENWLECIRLQVDKIQSDYIPSNALSLAESKFRPSCVPQAIYAEQKMVGFLMYELQKENCELTRLMIDYHHQRKGYGKSALRLLIQKMRIEHSECQQIVANFIHENVGALRLFKQLGFQIKPLQEDEFIARFSISSVTEKKIEIVP